MAFFGSDWGNDYNPLMDSIAVMNAKLEIRQRTINRALRILKSVYQENTVSVELSAEISDFLKEHKYD
jgi:hypothetical protein